MAKKRPRINRELQRLFTSMRAETDAATYRGFTWEGRKYRMFRVECLYNDVSREVAILDANIIGNDVKVLLRLENGSHVIENVYIRNEKGRYEPTDKTEFTTHTKPFGKDDVIIRNYFRQLQPYTGRAA